MFRAGDYAVVRGFGLFGWITRFMTRSNWNHAALILSDRGEIAEVVGTGLRRGSINEYKDRLILDSKLDDEERAKVVHYAEVMLGRRESYGLLQLLAILLQLLTRSRLVIKLDGTMICSEFVADALSHGGVIWPKDPSLISPADLSEMEIQ